jgi:hypothetical protein
MRACLTAGHAIQIVVKDRIAPSVGALSDQVVEQPGSTAEAATGTPSATDLSTHTYTAVDSEAPGKCTDAGSGVGDSQTIKVITRVFTFTDRCGNQATPVTQTITGTMPYVEADETDGLP